MKRIYVKFYLENGKIKKLSATKAIRRILSQVSLVKFKKAYCRVDYGEKIDVHNKIVSFYNDGYYTDKQEFKDVIKIFWNEN